MSSDVATFIAMTRRIAQQRNQYDFRVECHEIEKKHEIVSENKKVGNVSFVPCTYLLIHSKLANLGTEMSDRNNKFLSRQSDEVCHGVVAHVRGNELTLPYYVLT